MNKRKELVITWGIKIIAIMSLLPIFGILLYLIIKGLPAINWKFLTSMPENSGRAGGILAPIIGTLWLTVGTIIVSVPFGVLTAIFLVEYSKDNWLKRTINLMIINLAGIPSVVYGLFGLSLFVVWMGFGVSIISGSLTLGIMSLPVIITSTKEALLAVPNNLREASLALGATKWETVWKVVLPASMYGIVTGVILSIGRAAGETAPIIFTVATAYQNYLPETVLDKTMALPFHLFVISTEVNNMPMKNMYGTAFILVFITVGFNLVGTFIRSRFKKSR
ncbi:phosphate ABC transporter permease PstA [Haliovirga abyssi]|uniref:Phosphate transport system permease protein PstA n=1 Tax=Haliovirga abyssi TaxID=2996794 RepID=A0AAU9D970_9FUSO|nr:phosphate ABC transporter permease PstA [Haliovirga abyssi]BDU49825.1 phosphate transport system permease protein PstA [Haliovirga abyssi]